MSGHGKSAFLVILNILLIGGLDCSNTNRVQAFQTFNESPILLQTTQSKPTPQPTISPGSQASSSVNLQPQKAFEWIKQHPSPVLLTVIVLFYLAVLGFRPTWLLLLPLDKIPKTPLSPEISIPPAIGSFLKYRPRVLDAWVSERIAQAQEQFEQRLTVKERTVHIPIPVELGGKQPAIASFGISDLKPVFSKQVARLLIVGEGGVGKTSLACQIAKWGMAEKKAERLCNHQMLPVLIEEELEATEGKSPLLEAIARQIKDLRVDEKPISEELLKQLLEKRRILVIVDHLSEMSEPTRKATRSRDSSSPVNALIVTSRLEDILGKEVTYTTIKPQRVSGKQLSIFMDAYLSQRGKRDLFDDSEYFDALRRLSLIVTDERDVTVLFAKLYADQMIAVAEGLVTDDLPDNIPDLMLSYINEVNREKDSKIEDDIVQRDLRIVSWECLKQTFKPEPAERDQVINCLAALEGEGDAAKESAKKRLKYLEERLALIRTVSPAKTKIRFVLDPLAEYLSGLYLLELYGKDECAWKVFLEEAKNKPGNLEDIQGFLLAVRDCYITASQSRTFSDLVVEELGKLAGLDLEILKQEQLKRRVRDLVSDLSRVNAKDRLYAVRELGIIGSDAKAAISTLISRVLKDEDILVRRYSIESIQRIGLGTEAEYSLLLNGLKDADEEVCIGVVEVLTLYAFNMQLTIATLIEMLKERVHFPNSRRHSIHPSLHNSIQQALIRAGEIAVPGLIQLLNHDKPGVRDTALMALQSIGWHKRIEPYSKETSLALVKLLDSKDVDDRRGACYALKEICSTKEESLVGESLIKVLSDPDPLIRVLAARILIKVNPQTAKCLVPNLVDALRSKDPSVRCYASVVLGETALSGQESIAALETVCNDPEEMVRQAAFEALSKLRL